MVSDRGQYPNGMVDGETMLTFDTPKGAIDTMTAALEAPERRLELARNALELMRDSYNKTVQWRNFKQLVDGL
jgi:hypothetical protein